MEIWGNAFDAVWRLAGVWALDRTLDGRALLKGRATFEATEAASLAYLEQGTMRLADGREFEATRRYLFQSKPTGFAVFFAETPLRLFHEVTLKEADGSLSGHALHLCGEDRYDSRYQFRIDGTFVIRHAVSGPKKSYALETLYRREPASQ